MYNLEFSHQYLFSSLSERYSRAQDLTLSPSLLAARLWNFDRFLFSTM